MNYVLCVYAQWDKVNGEQKKEKEEELDRNYGAAHWGLQSGTEMLKMMKMLTHHVLSPFLRPELAERVAAMLQVAPPHSFLSSISLGAHRLRA